jgi:FdrA protein
MIVRVQIRKGAYYDSVALLQAQRALRELPGVEEAGVVMGTPANLALLVQAGLAAPELREATADDLVVAVRATSEEAALRALERFDALLVTRSEVSEEYRPKSVRTAKALLDGANLALVSVPGRFAASVAEEALREGLHVMLFSDNVPLEDEVRLKALASQRGLLLMGPDCGTALLRGVGLGFANAVRRGPCGIVAASGTGLQEVTSLLHRWGVGVSHGIGTGGRDLSDRVGGATFQVALGALAEDPETSVIVLLSKPPSATVASRILGMAAACGKPVVVNFLGADLQHTPPNVYGAATLEEAALQAARLTGAPLPEFPEGAAEGRCGEGRRWIRGLYSGGTLCAEAQVVLRESVGGVWSNVPLAPELRLVDPLRSVKHTLLDLGSDEFTVGRLHPMLDLEVRCRRILQESGDPEVGVVLFDVVLGYGAHPDPASELRTAVEAARRKTQDGIAFVASVCGTENDPQGYTRQVETLREAGVIVVPTNAWAARLAGRLVEARAPRRTPPPLVRLQWDGTPRPLPEAPEPVRDLLQKGPRVVNVRLELFAESLRQQGVPVVSVDWRPPAGGDADLLGALRELGG